MKVTCHQFGAGEWEAFARLLKQREEYLKMHGLDRLPQVFDYGDRVGFFGGNDQIEPATGIILSDSERFVRVKTDDSRIHEISPFMLFALK